MVLERYTAQGIERATLTVYNERTTRVVREDYDLSGKLVRSETLHPYGTLPNIAYAYLRQSFIELKG